ncbi:hypothetical protein CFP56_022373 [Quercus suber]|uniref:Uncharacterized protein n=1 Tax=Quercus suber TaxID=58331 RepID=A0AAW0KBD8_QUESU
MGELCGLLDHIQSLTDSNRIRQEPEKARDKEEDTCEHYYISNKRGRLPTTHLGKRVSSSIGFSEAMKKLKFSKILGKFCLAFIINRLCYSIG